MKVFLNDDPYADREAGRGWGQKGIWPASWVTCQNPGAPPYVIAFRRRFKLSESAVIRVHVSADERYILFVDGKRCGRGSERGDAANWFFETYDLPFEAGEHTLVAQVWAMDCQRAFAQMTVTPGFILSPQEEKYVGLLATGEADWDAKRMDGYRFLVSSTAWGTGANTIIEAAKFPWGFESGAGGDWQPVQTQDFGADARRRNEYEHTQLLTPAVLPAMMEEPRRVGTVRHAAYLPPSEAYEVPILKSDNLPEQQAAWNQMMRGEGGVTIPPKTKLRVLLDLENYYCAYPEITITGGKGARVRVKWQEALIKSTDGIDKGNRDEIEGKYFASLWNAADVVCDVFMPAGGDHRHYQGLWWQAGRYIEIGVQTAADPVTIEDFFIHETRYPMEQESRFDSSDRRLNEILPLALRTLQMCSHETFMDCPFYEQLQYVGDTRLEALVTYAVAKDDRLARKAIRMFAASQMPTGLTQSRYPSRKPQIIPPFSLWWVAMLHDFALWRNDKAFVAQFMPQVRRVLDYFRSLINAQGLVEHPEGWNFMDWVPEWPSGIPPQGHEGANGLINLQYALVLKQAAELEEYVGEPELAARWRRIGACLREGIVETFWDAGRGLFAEDAAHAHYSEHSQCLAILDGEFPGELLQSAAKGLLAEKDLSRTTIYFTHYLFETYRLLGKPDAIMNRLELWFGLKANGLKTTIEMPEPTRSDCHAWASHPLFHVFGTFLGIRPASFGFETVRIEPQLGALTEASGSMVHPNGAIEVDVRTVKGELTGSVQLPDDVTGTLVAGNREIKLKSGLTRF